VVTCRHDRPEQGRRGIAQTTAPRCWARCAKARTRRGDRWGGTRRPDQGGPRCGLRRPPSGTCPSCWRTATAREPSAADLLVSRPVTVLGWRASPKFHDLPGADFTAATW